MTRLLMLDSPAFWALKPIERTILSVIEIEHMRHGGVENGRLIVTRRQLQKRGIPKQVVAPSIRALEALGFIEITQRGAAGIGDHAQAHRFRLTYVQPKPTDEWRNFHDPALAKRSLRRLVKRRISGRDGFRLRGVKKQIGGPNLRTGKVSKPIPGPFPAAESGPPIGIETDTGTGPHSDTTIYILGGRGPAQDTGHETAAPTPTGARLLVIEALQSNEAPP